MSLSFDIPDDGLTYAVTGSIAELGNWNPEKAPRSKGGSISIDVPKYSVVLYKLVKVRDSQYQWSKKANSEVFVDKSKSIKAEF